LALVVSLVLVVQGDDEKEKRCKQLSRQFDQCTRKAYNTYDTAIKAGSDGKPDFRARKSCNYLEDSLVTCGEKLVGECNTKKEVTEMQDKQIRAILANLKSSVKTWDSNKCPAVRAYIDRMKAAEEGGAAAPAAPAAEPEKPEPEVKPEVPEDPAPEDTAQDSPKAKDSSSSLAASSLIILLSSVLLLP